MVDLMLDFGFFLGFSMIISITISAGLLSTHRLECVLWQRR